MLPLANLRGQSPQEPTEEPDDLQAAAILNQRTLDLDLAERVARALRTSAYGPLRGIEVSAEEGLVSLQGRVPSYHLKQVAQTTALAVPGIRHLRNALEVGLRN